MNDLVTEIQASVNAFEGGPGNGIDEGQRVTKAIESIRETYTKRLSALETQIRDLPLKARKRDWTQYQQRQWTMAESIRLGVQVKGLQSVIKTYLS